MKLNKFSMKQMSVTEMSAIKAGSKSSVGNGGSLSSTTDTNSCEKENQVSNLANYLSVIHN